MSDEGLRHVTRAEIREIERRAIEERGLSEDVLMENAGRAVADLVAERASPSSPVVVVCGPGSNGGDGFVTARLLSERGYEVEVLATRRDYDVETPTGRNWERARDLVDFVGRFKRRPMAVLVDAIFGTGLSRPVQGRELELIREMNALDRRWFPVVAVDIPSGLDCDTGRPLGAVVEASATVTFTLPKAGFQKPFAKRPVGELFVADIGIPADLLKP